MENDVFESTALTTSAELDSAGFVSLSSFCNGQAKLLLCRKDLKWLFSLSWPLSLFRFWRQLIFTDAVWQLGNSFSCILGCPNGHSEWEEGWKWKAALRCKNGKLPWEIKDCHGWITIVSKFYATQNINLDSTGHRTRSVPESGFFVPAEIEK